MSTKNRGPITGRAPVTGDVSATDVTRVLMVLDSFSFGGAENLIAELGQNAPADLAVTVASLAPADKGSGKGYGEFLDRLNTAGLHPSYFSMRRLIDPLGFIRLVRTLRRTPVDVVHAHLGYSAIILPLAARMAGKPVVATLHMSPQRHARRGARFKELLSVRVPARLGRIVFVSQHAYAEFAHDFGPASPTWRVIPNGVDLERYTPRRQSEATDRPVWAVVSALRPDKNHVDLIKAWSDVVAKHPQARLLVVGEGPARPDIERAVAAAGLTESVQLLGRRDDIPEILQTVDGVVSASIDEALPTALIEAAACGLPVVASDAGGTREIVADGVTGRLVPLRDVPALTEALLDTIENPEQAAAYGVAGRAMVEEKYSMPKWADELKQLYREVITARQ